MKIPINQVQCKCRGVAVDGSRDYLKWLTGDPPSQYVELSEPFVGIGLVQFPNYQLLILFCNCFQNGRDNYSVSKIGLFLRI